MIIFFFDEIFFFDLPLEIFFWLFEKIKKKNDSDVEKSEEEEYFTSSEDEFEEKSEDDYGKEESDEEWKEGSGGIYIYFNY